MDPRALALVAGVLGLALFLTVGGISQLLNIAFGIWFTEVFLFLGLGWVLLRLAGHDPVRATGLGRGAPKAAFLGFALGVANFFALVVPIQYTVQRLTPPWLRELFDASRLFEGQTPVELALIAAGVTIAAPLCEEFFFRGILQHHLMPPVLSRAAALGVTAVVFSAFHLDPVGFLARVELGLLFGWLFLRTGSLWPSILAHSANNLVSTVLFLAARRAGLQESEAESNDPRAILALAVMGGAALWALLSVARRMPSLWDAPEEPPPVAPRPRPSLARLLLPWVLGATLSLAGLAAVDARGIRLNLFDMRYKLPPLPRKAPDALHAERAALRELRAQARRGEVPLEAYEEERVRLAEDARQREAPAPAP
jgi:hypothetical protein